MKFLLRLLLSCISQRRSLVYDCAGTSQTSSVEDKPLSVCIVEIQVYHLTFILSLSWNGMNQMNSEFRTLSWVLQCKNLIWPCSAFNFRSACSIWTSLLSTSCRFVCGNTNFGQRMMYLFQQTPDKNRNQFQTFFVGQSKLPCRWHWGWVGIRKLLTWAGIFIQMRPHKLT